MDRQKQNIAADLKGDGYEATKIFTRELDQQKLLAMAARVTQLEDEDIELRARHEQREQETLEFVAYFQHEILTRDKQITKLDDELATVRLNHAQTLGQMQQAHDTERLNLIHEAAAKNEAASEQISFLQEELHQLELFRDMKDNITEKIKDLESQLELKRAQALETTSALERKFLEERALLLKEHEKAIEMVKHQAKDDARKGLGAETRKIVLNNKCISEELRFQMQMTNELLRDKKHFKARAKALNVELQLQIEKEAEFAKQTQRLKSELKQLRANLHEAEEKLAAGLAAASCDAQVYATRHERDREELTLDAEGLRELLRLKNRELRKVRRLANTILSQRTEIEQFLLDSLELIKREIEVERKAKPERDVERYHGDVNNVKTGLRFPKLTVPTKPAPRQGSIPPGSSQQVDLRQLSWEHRERILRLVFAKINHCQSFVNIQSESLQESHEFVPKQSRSPNQREKTKSLAVYFATEPQTRQRRRDHADDNVTEESLNMILSGMSIAPRVPTRTSTSKGQ